MRGYHLCTADRLWPWLHEELYEAEGRGAHATYARGEVYGSVRLLRRLRWGRDDALVLFSAQLADLAALCEAYTLSMPRPYARADVTWWQLRDRSASAERWYRAFATATERVVVAMAGLCFQHASAASSAGAAHRERAERHVRAAFFAHLHGSAATAGSEPRSA